MTNRTKNTENILEIQIFDGLNKGFILTIGRIRIPDRYYR